MQVVALQCLFCKAMMLLGMNRTWLSIKRLRAIRVAPLRHQPHRHNASQKRLYATSKGQYKNLLILCLVALFFRGV